ncbi:KGK domain-containing protein [Fischerella sp. PCC 9605]|uniref:KGK domain-containing protein n=1 Tax=Fischerella sp. PCC 9605 TaxID=1173024 RepID=UPI000479BB8E|nr:KGK domain-containing protein [Fischerella sp. PCC 9605]
MNYGWEALGQDDVVSMNSGQILMPHPTFKVDEFTARMKQVLSGLDELKQKWLGEGQSCEILKPGAKDWQKGKIRITLEFYPDEPESPLDELRQQLEQIERSQ